MTCFTHLLEIAEDEESNWEKDERYDIAEEVDVSHNHSPEVIL